MNNIKFGPLEFLIGKWSSGDSWTGENRAPDPDRQEENTRFKQEMNFEPILDVKNHEQLICGLRYSTTAWEEGSELPFHEEVGYWLWDAENKQVMKSFIVPRGISVNAGGTAKADSKNFKVEAKLGSHTYGLCSNIFLDQEFRTISYEIEIEQIDSNTFSYNEDSQIKIKGQEEVFHHIEKNTLKRV